MQLPFTDCYIRRHYIHGFAPVWQTEVSFNLQANMQQLADLRERQNELIEKVMIFQKDMRDFKEHLVKEASQFTSNISTCY